MKKLIYSLIICLMIVTGRLSAQEGKFEYLFNDFQKSLIYYKDGRVFGVKVNYNLARNAFMFIDENDNNNIKLFAEPDMVRILKIDNRIFQLDSKGLAQEVLNKGNRSAMEGVLKQPLSIPIRASSREAIPTTWKQRKSFWPT